VAYHAKDMKLAALVLAAIALGPRAAQEDRVLAPELEPNPRHDLGWRLVELERDWDAHLDAQERLAALERIQEATRRFFALNLAGAAEELDQARERLRGEPLAFPERLWIWPERGLLEASATRLRVLLRPRYGAAQTDWRASCAWEGSRAPALALPLAFDASGLAVLDLPLAGLRAGDQRLRLEFSRAGEDDRVHHARDIAVSFAANLADRLAKLEGDLEQTHARPASLEGATTRELFALLRGLAGGPTAEADYPAARLLEEAEAVSAAARENEPWYGPSRAGEFWLCVPLETPSPASADHDEAQSPRRRPRNQAHLRWLVPPGTAEKGARPLVVALHGMGGSENLFFVGYGDGLLARACAERGWYLAAVRLGWGRAPLANLVEALARRYPIDRARVFLVGHSMGAMTGWSEVRKAPEAWRAFAPISGGGARLGSRERIVSLPILAVAGDRDFGLPAAQATIEALTKAGAPAAELRVLPNTEHLMVVREALPQILSWFDGLKEP
jgi:predicted esterase